MNAKQFINNSVCALIDKVKFFREIVRIAALLLYPDYPFVPKFALFKNKNKLFEILKLYILLFILLFIVQGGWSLLYGQFFSDNNPQTTTFLEDKENLWNYLLICQLYVIIGYYVLKNNETLLDALKTSKLYEKLDLSGIEKNENSKYGYLGLILLFIITLYFSSGYAYDITNFSTSKYWFMAEGPINVTYSKLGFYYFFTNFILLFFVITVGASYIGFIKKIGYISSKIDAVMEKPINDLSAENWMKEDDVRKWLSPISIQVFLFQLFILVLALNLVLWNSNKQGIGINYHASVFALIILGIWLFTLPRYYLNYKIFQVWKKMGRLEYRNINLPWLIGASGLIDLILFSFLLKYLIGQEWSDLINKFFGS